MVHTPPFFHFSLAKTSNCTCLMVHLQAQKVLQAPMAERLEQTFWSIWNTLQIQYIVMQITILIFENHESHMDVKSFTILQDKRHCIGFITHILYPQAVSSIQWQWYVNWRLLCDDSSDISDEFAMVIDYQINIYDFVIVQKRIKYFLGKLIKFIQQSMSSVFYKKTLINLSSQKKETKID